jgi:hypothetical protein
MKLRNYILITLFTLVALTSFISWVFAQDALVTTSIAKPASEEKLHALSLTRFHFITLKQFHSALFSDRETENSISDEEARMLNTALNAFLTSAERETLLLEALRQNKAIRLRFSVREEQEDVYEMETHPTKDLVLHLKPVVRSVPIVIEIRPLLDRPVAFQVSVVRDKARRMYEVDWSGKMSQIKDEAPSAIDRHLTSFQNAAKAIATSV